MKIVGAAAVLAVVFVFDDRGALAQSDGASVSTVPTFYGLRRLEADAQVSDAEKVRAWSEFVERAQKQIEYAEKAKRRWKDAAKYRLVESARLAERDPALGLRQRVAQWQAVLDAYPDSREARTAKTRIGHWRAEELARLVREADKVETEGALKVERIRAWLSVLAWSPESKAGKAARKRIDALQTQLFREAETIDGMKRLDDALRIEAWQDVLRGDPSSAQRTKAEARLEDLKKS